MFQIKIFAEDFSLSHAIALDLVMASLCKEHGWDAHITAAQMKRKKLLNDPESLAEELKYVPFEEVRKHLEPEPTDWLSDFDKAEQLWVSDLTRIEYAAEDSLQILGF